MSKTTKRRNNVAEREKLILANLSYVRALARNFAKKSPSHLDYRDLEAYGIEGLIEAIDNYDPRAGASLNTFIYRCASWKILDGLQKLSPLRNGQYKRQKTETLSFCSLDEIVREPEDSGYSADTIIESCQKVQEYDLFHKALASLRDREQQLLLLIAESGLTQVQIAKLWKLGKSRISEIRKKAIQKLRETQPIKRAIKELAA